MKKKNVDQAWFEKEAKKRWKSSPGSFGEMPCITFFIVKVGRISEAYLIRTNDKANGFKCISISSELLKYKLLYLC